MYTLWSDEAWDSSKWFQSISTLLIDTESCSALWIKLEEVSQKFDQTDLKFTRVRTNTSYAGMVNELLITFFDSLDREDVFFLFCSGVSDEMIFGDMYEEIFLLVQWRVDDEIIFCPDANNMMKRYSKISTYKEYGVTKILEQDSKQSSITQVMDIMAGIINFLREHYGTYRARSQSNNHFDQMSDFDRELHFRCQVTENFLNLLDKYIGEHKILESGLLHTQSEQCLILDY